MQLLRYHEIIDLFVSVVVHACSGSSNVAAKQIESCWGILGEVRASLDPEVLKMCSFIECSAFLREENI